MTAFDYAVLLIIGLSILLSVMRGLVREVMSLVSWVAAFWIANAYTAQLAPLLPQEIPNVSLRFLAAFLILFLATLLVMSLVTIAVAEFVKTLGLGPMDRVLGASFGLARGVLIVITLLLLAGLTSLPRQAVWRNAMFSAPLEAVAMQVKTWLPDDLAKRINYE